MTVNPVPYVTVTAPNGGENWQIGNVQTGSALGWGDAFVRWCILQGPFALVTVVPVVLWSTLLFGAAGWSAFLMYDAYNKSDHRALHDRVVHSLVAQTSR